MPLELRSRATRNVVRLVVLAAVVAATSGTTYLAYAAISLYPSAEGVARRFLSHLFQGDPGAAHALFDPALKRTLPPAAFLTDAARNELLYAGVKTLELAALDLNGVSLISVRGPVTYQAGVTGEATVALRRGPLGWRVTDFSVRCPELLDRLREHAQKAGHNFIEALRGGDWRAVAALVDTTAMPQLSAARLQALQRSLARKVEDMRFAESRTQVQFPNYTLHGALRTTDGQPYSVELQVTWKRGELKVTQFKIEAVPAWLTEQRIVARQVAANFISAMRAGSASEMRATCHPRLVETLTHARFDELAADFGIKLSDIVLDDARTVARHPIYDFAGSQKPLIGPDLPASIRVQYVDGSYLITGIQFD